MNSNEISVFLTKMKGAGRSPLKVLPRNAAIGAVGGFIVIVILALMTNITSEVWIMAPFGASCVLAFGLWDAPLSQPRNYYWRAFDIDICRLGVISSFR
jgi:CBS-domain-containing membrane protein